MIGLVERLPTADPQFRKRLHWVRLPHNDFATCPFTMALAPAALAVDVCSSDPHLHVVHPPDDAAIFDP